MTKKQAFLALPLILTAMIAVLTAVTLARMDWQDSHALRQAPVFDRPEFGSAALRETVSLVNFFASWCVPCEAEHAVLMDLKNSHGIAIYGINFKDGASSRMDYLQRLGNPYRAVTPDEDGALGALWQTAGVPETFVIDAEGRIRDHIRGPVTADMAKDRIIPLIRSLR